MHDQTVRAAMLRDGAFDPVRQNAQVEIRYERTDTIDGKACRSMYVDAAPAGATGLEEGALAMTVNLRGVTIQNVQGELECEPLPEDDAGWLEWFKGHIPHLKDARIANLALVAGSAVARTGELDLPNELIKGPVADWMLVDGDPVESEQETFTAHLTYSWMNAAGTRIISTVKDQVFTVQRETTNGVTDTYYGVEQFTPSEPQPLGLAAHEYAILNRPEFGGTVVLKETECTGLVKLGQALNLTGFQQAAWATMAEPVQSVVLDFDRGVTTAQFGPPGHLDIPTILSLIR